jgi:Xaa-Pro aminopeptidase
MISEIDALMQENGVDVLLVLGNIDHNPAMMYFTGGGHVSNADLIKERGKDPVLFCNPMEREEAAKTGLRTVTFAEFKWKELVIQTGGDLAEARARSYAKQFQSLGITSGRVAVYGMVEIGPVIAALERVTKYLPDLQFGGYFKDPILMPAMMTKDSTEVERIRRMGKITTEVIARTADWLRRHAVSQDVLVHSDGAPLKIGAVKNQINLWLAELGAENPEGTIFAIGRDAGVPHSAGAPDDLVRLGQPIVFDIFPCEIGGGYFYDITRTWSLGYATEEVQALYQQVLEVYNKLFSNLKVNMPFKEVQKLTCDLFEEIGHPTIQTIAEIEEGYIHSVGHGVGLRVHEMPFSGINATERDALVPGTVFTIEPGLYYPSRGMGVRLEDTYYTRPDGTFEVLADYPYDLVIPMK